MYSVCINHPFGWLNDDRGMSFVLTIKVLITITAGMLRF